jgi:hypothetical protein
MSSLSSPAARVIACPPLQPRPIEQRRFGEVGSLDPHVREDALPGLSFEASMPVKAVCELEGP